MRLPPRLRLLRLTRADACIGSVTKRESRKIGALSLGQGIWAVLARQAGWVSPGLVAQPG